MRVGLVLAALCIAGPAFTQDARQYAPPDEKLWEAMQRALADVPMSLSSHQSVQRILEDVRREAHMQAGRAKAIDPKTEKNSK